MKSLKCSGWRTGPAAAICVLVAVLGLGALPLLQAAEEPAAASPSNSTHSVTLQYREQAGLPVASAGLPFSEQTDPFKKEPNCGKRPVMRGLLKFGNSADQFVGLLWDYTERKLYLDFNRNHDLTDDGVQVSENHNYSSTYYFQTFTNLHFAFKTAMGEHRLLTDLNLRCYPNNRGVGASLRSFWDGKISLGGKDWQVGLVESGGFSSRIGSTDGGYLLLRPWEQRQRPLNLDDGSLTSVGFCRNLFFGRQSYQVDCTYIQEANGPGYRLALKEQAAELGELKLPGQFIQRLVLTSGFGSARSVVVLDTPRPVERVPVGRYEARVYLQQGNANAHPRNGGYQNHEPRVVVSATQPEVLAMGGPLTNTVSVSRHGRDLYLSYSLVGANGELYELGGGRKNPEFVAYQAGKKVGSGKFEFG